MIHDGSRPSPPNGWRIFAAARSNSRKFCFHLRGCLTTGGDRAGKITHAQRERRLSGVNCRLSVVTGRKRSGEITFRTNDLCDMCSGLACTIRAPRRMHSSMPSVTFRPRPAFSALFDTLCTTSTHLAQPSRALRQVRSPLDADRPLPCRVCAGARTRQRSARSL